MSIPGFNAGASTYRTSNIYRASYGTPAGDVAIIPQQCKLVCRLDCTPLSAQMSQQSEMLWSGKPGWDM